MGRRARQDTSILTDGELEMMNPLWELGEASVRQVLDALPAERDLAYTTVATMLRVLEQKGFVRSRKEGRSVMYTPAVAKPAYQSHSVGRLVKQLFAGSTTSLVRQLLAAEDVSAEDLAAIRELLDAEEAP